MNPLPATSTPPADSLEAAVRDWGGRIFARMEGAETPSLFTRKGLYGALMDWAMQDEAFKTQLFRFVDVLPALTSASEVSRHLTEYLDNESARLNPALRAALKATGFAGGLLGGSIRTQVTGMAGTFMLGNDEKTVVATLRRLHEHDIAFTVDVLGETVVSEKEADEYAARYLALLDLLARETAKWKDACKSDVTSQGEVPRLNVSVKLSAFYSQIHGADPETAIAKLSERLRPVLRRAKALGAFICVDMESHAMKNLTLRLFKTIFAEPEFAAAPACGLALQAYLKDAEADLRELIDWARAQRKRVTVRLVKGAYWDYETVIARQKGWPVPVWETKPETDACYERCTTLLLENSDAVGAAFASHNVRSLAHVLAQAQRLGVDPRQFEFQVLYGMADAIAAALLQLGCRVREYCPVGDLLPGMAYFVRRLLENTSNEGFLANKFAKGASRDELLKNPRELIAGAPRLVPPPPKTAGLPEFQNEPPTPLGRAEEREKIRAALADWRGRLGRKYPLVIQQRRGETREWIPSLNPANQNEVIGLAACGTTADVEAAIDAARSAQPDWARTPVEERARCVEQLAELLRREKASLIALLGLEAGRTWAEADAEVAAAIDFCHLHAAEMRGLDTAPRTQSVPGESNRRHWRPRGVGAVITPWSSPLAVLTGITTAAVVGGNSVLLKPSSRAPVTAARLVELAREAGFPPGVLNLVTGRGSEIGAHLAAHPRLEFIAFAGSTGVGLKVREAAGRASAGSARLKQCVCALSGANCLIVDGDADLDEAVQGTMQSVFAGTGQRAGAVSRLIVLAPNYTKFLERCLAAAASLRVGPAETPGAVIGPVIDRAAQARLLELIAAGRREATLAWQGQVPADPNGCWVPPTIFTDVPATSRLFREEIFGPVVGISRAADFDQALALANDADFALAAGLYSRSPVNIERARRELVCGNLFLNRAVGGGVVGRQPFGGSRLSGDGSQLGGRDYLRHFLLPCVITENCLRRGFAPAED